jgi:cyanate lyase
MGKTRGRQRTNLHTHKLIRSFEEIGKVLGCDEVYAASIFYGQVYLAEYKQSVFLSYSF